MCIYSKNWLENLQTWWDQCLASWMAHEPWWSHRRPGWSVSMAAAEGSPWETERWARGCLSCLSQWGTWRRCHWASGSWWTWGVENGECVCVCVCVCAPLPPIARPPFHYLMIKRPSQWTKLARLLAHLASFSTIFFLTKSDMIFLNHVPVYQENSWASSWIWAARVRWRNDKLHPRPMAHAIIIAHCMRNLIQSLIAQHTTSAPPPRC